MKKMLLGLTAVFALSTVAPAFAADDAAKADAKPDKATKAKKSKAKKDDGGDAKKGDDAK